MVKKASPIISPEAKRFRDFRKNVLHMSQQELADILKKSQPILQRYECGKVRVPNWVVKFLIDKYNMAPDFWFKGEGPKIKNKDDRSDSSLLRDIKTLKNENDLLKLQVDVLEKKIHILARDFYAFSKIRKPTDV